MPVLDKEKTAALEEATAFDQKYRLTTDQYYKMGEAGIFGDDKRVELIDGVIIKLAPIGPPHGFSGNSLTELLRAALGREFYVAHETSITVANGTEPQPDLYVARGPRETYRTRHPLPEDLVLVVEVSDSSLASDRKRKLGLYASSGIPEFWIVNLVDKQVEVYSKPSGREYAETTIFKAGDELPLSFAAGKSLPVEEFVP